MTQPYTLTYGIVEKERRRQVSLHVDIRATNGTGKSGGMIIEEFALVNGGEITFRCPNYFIVVIDNNEIAVNTR